MWGSVFSKEIPDGNRSLTALGPEYLALTLSKSRYSSLPVSLGVNWKYTLDLSRSTDQVINSYKVLRRLTHDNC